MKALSKLTISALLILYSFVGFAILSPLISILAGNPIFITIGLSFSSVFLLITFFASRIFTVKWRGIFSLLKDGEATETWLLLHSLFTSIIGRIYPWIALIASLIPLFSVAHINRFPTTFMFVWIILLFSVIGLWSLHLIIGMGYRWLCKGTTLGIQSFSVFALQHLKNKQRKGIAYLLKAFLLLKDCLKHEELELKELNNAIKAARCFLQFQSKIPYEHLQMLALELKRFPSMEHLPRTLSTFNRNPKVKWTESFTETKRTKRKVLELIVVIATVLSGLTFLPETTRSTLLEILQSVGSAENIETAMGFFLFAVTVHISSLAATYYLTPFEARTFIPSEAT